MNKETVRPLLTSYETILILFSKLAQKGKNILRLDDLVQKLFKYKDKCNTKVLFEDISFKQSLDTITSVDIEDSLGKLQVFGAIGKLNPAYEKIVIYITPKEADAFLSKYSQYDEALEEISKEF